MEEEEAESYDKIKAAVLRSYELFAGKEVCDTNMILRIVFLISGRLLIDAAAFDIQKLSGMLKKRQMIQRAYPVNEKLVNPYYNNGVHRPYHKSGSDPYPEAVLYHDYADVKQSYSQPYLEKTAPAFPEKVKKSNPSPEGTNSTMQSFTNHQTGPIKDAEAGQGGHAALPSYPSSKISPSSDPDAISQPEAGEDPFIYHEMIPPFYSELKLLSSSTEEVPVSPQKEAAHNSKLVQPLLVDQVSLPSEEPPQAFPKVAPAPKQASPSTDKTTPALSPSPPPLASPSLPPLASPSPPLLTSHSTPPPSSPSLPPLSSPSPPPLTSPSLPPLSSPSLPPLSFPSLPPLSSPSLPPLSSPSLPPLSSPSQSPPSPNEEPCSSSHLLHRPSTSPQHPPSTHSQPSPSATEVPPPSWFSPSPPSSSSPAPPSSTSLTPPSPSSLTPPSPTEQPLPSSASPLPASATELSRPTPPSPSSPPTAEALLLSSSPSPTPWSSSELPLLSTAALPLPTPPSPPLPELPPPSSTQLPPPSSGEISSPSLPKLPPLAAAKLPPEMLPLSHELPLPSSEVPPSSPSPSSPNISPPSAAVTPPSPELSPPSSLLFSPDVPAPSSTNLPPPPSLSIISPPFSPKMPPTLSPDISPPSSLNLPSSSPPSTEMSSPPALGVPSASSLEVSQPPSPSVPPAPEVTILLSSNVTYPSAESSSPSLLAVPSPPSPQEPPLPAPEEVRPASTSVVPPLTEEATLSASGERSLDVKSTPDPEIMPKLVHPQPTLVPLAKTQATSKMTPPPETEVLSAPLYATPLLDPLHPAEPAFPSSPTMAPLSSSEAAPPTVPDLMASSSVERASALSPKVPPVRSTDGTTTSTAEESPPLSPDMASPPSSEVAPLPPVNLISLPKGTTPPSAFVAAVPSPETVLPPSLQVMPSTVPAGAVQSSAKIIPPSLPEQISVTYSKVTMPPNPEVMPPPSAETALLTNPEAKPQSYSKIPSSTYIKMEFPPYPKVHPPFIPETDSPHSAKGARLTNLEIEFPNLEVQSPLYAEAVPYTQFKVMSPADARVKPLSNSVMEHQLNPEKTPQPNPDGGSLPSSHESSQFFSEVRFMPYHKRISWPPHRIVEYASYSRVGRPVYPRLDPPVHPKIEPLLYPKMESQLHPKIEPLLYMGMDLLPNPGLEHPHFPEMELPPYPAVELPLRTKMDPAPHSSGNPPSLGTHPKTIHPFNRLSATHPEMAAAFHQEKVFPRFSAMKQNQEHSYPNGGTKPKFHSESPIQQYKQPCLPGWTHYKYLSSCYQFFPQVELTWLEAELRCRQYMPNGHLASIHWNEHNQFIQSLIKAQDPSQPTVWIGLSDCYEEGIFLWSDGSVLDFTKWSDDQLNSIKENENCVSFNSADIEGRWNENNCAEDRPFVCTYNLA
ncbi:mucin-2-like [Hypanus sabinus]|uniref:mucin-2-like n=1 Tax=Hypanus sabinus TaxID=79690 RepID=UPI0028C3B520|nr:mucin-2-like [Hypanus sabinus]